MSKKKRRNKRPQHFKNSAKILNSVQNSLSEVSGSTPPRGAESDFAPPEEKILKPVCPEPDKGYQPLSKYIIHMIVRGTMQQMERLVHNRGVSLDLEYWRGITRSILEQPSPDDALVIPSPAGSGKSTWILAFHLALKKLFQSNPELEDSLVGTAIVLQKVDDLNALADELNEDCPADKPFMVPLQGWNLSGKRRGFCLNPNVGDYSECLGKRCVYTAQCPILAFREKAPHAPVVGLTQERFYLLRQGDLSPILQRYGRDGYLYPRRFIIFDEKHLMAPVVALDTAQINEASTQFNDLIRRFDISDTRVRGLQQRLDFSVLRTFQKIRKAQCVETEQGIYDVPVGFLGLSEEEQEDAAAYYEFRNTVIEHQARFMSKPLSAVFSVMDHLYSGGICLFTKTNGFCIYRIGLSKLRFGDCQTMIFDATAEVDNDYHYLNHIQILSGTPKNRQRCVAFHIYTHRDLNVSKTAMQKPWKVPAFTELIASLIKNADHKVFICTYKDLAIELADGLKNCLAQRDFSKVLLMPDRDMPTLPYFNGTNGSNAFSEAETVVILGYPRLTPPTYLSFTCAACGLPQIRKELESLPDEKLLDRRFDVLELPSVRDYVAHHLAARLEQEIYRCAQRNPGFDGEINIHLFCPPRDVLAILCQRFPEDTKIIEYDELPECVERCKGTARRYGDGNTSFGRLTLFLTSWDGTPVYVSELRNQLGISPSVWKDLMADSRIRMLLDQHGVKRTGRGNNAMWSGPSTKCA